MVVLVNSWIGQYIKSQMVWNFAIYRTFFYPMSLFVHHQRGPCVSSYHLKFWVVIRRKWAFQFWRLARNGIPGETQQVPSWKLSQCKVKLPLKKKSCTGIPTGFIAVCVFLWFQLNIIYFVGVWLLLMWSVFVYLILLFLFSLYTTLKASYWRLIYLLKK